MCDTNETVECEGYDDATRSANQVYVAVRFEQMNPGGTYVLGTYMTMDAAVARLHDVARPHTLTVLNSSPNEVLIHKERMSLMWVKTLALGDVNDTKVILNQP